MGKDEQLPDPNLKQTALHQAGHAMVARDLGYTANWWIWEASDQPDVWLGRTEVIGSPKPEHSRLIGLAGELAVLLAAQQDLSVDHLEAQIGAGSLTEVDLEVVGDFDRDDLSLCREIVLKHLASIRNEARERPDVPTQVRRQKSRSFYN